MTRYHVAVGLFLLAVGCDLAMMYFGNLAPNSEHEGWQQFGWAILAMIIAVFVFISSIIVFIKSLVLWLRARTDHDRWASIWTALAITALAAPFVLFALRLI